MIVMVCEPLKEALQWLKSQNHVQYEYAKDFAERLGLSDDDLVEMVYAELPGWNEVGAGYLPVPCCWRPKYCKKGGNNAS